MTKGFGPSLDDLWGSGQPVCTENQNSAILVVKSTEHWLRNDGTVAVDRPMERCVFAK